MEECEFRGKTPHGCRWVYGYLVKDDSDNFYIIESCNDIYDLIMTKVDTKSVGRYTGRKLNNKKLYTNDILESYDEYGVIIWDDFLLQYMVKTQYYNYTLYNVLAPDTKVKLVGNIYDNPELLKEERRNERD